MKFKIIKTASNLAVYVETKFNEKMFTRVPQEAFTLKDKNENAVFSVLQGEPDFNEYSLTIPGKSFIVNVNKEATEENLEDLKFELSKIERYVELIENNVAHYYQKLVENAESIEVTSLEDAVEEAVVEE